MHRTSRFAIAIALLACATAAFGQEAKIFIFPPLPDAAPVICAEPYTVAPGATVIVMCTARTNAYPERWIAATESGHAAVSTQVVQSAIFFGHAVTAYVAVRNHSKETISRTARTVVYDAAGARAAPLAAAARGER